MTGDTPTVSLGTIENTSAANHITQGWQLTQVAVVTDLNSDCTDDTATLYSEALWAVIQVVGNLGSPCPNLQSVAHVNPDNPGVDSKNPSDPLGFVPAQAFIEEFIPDIISIARLPPDPGTPAGSSYVKIKIVYRGFPPPTFELESNLTTVETNIDKGGTAITVQYTYPAGYWLTPAFASVATLPQPAMTTVDLNEPVFTAHFVVFPLAAGQSFTQTIDGGTPDVFNGPLSALDMATVWGRINGLVSDAPFKIGRILGQAWQWKIIRVRSTSMAGGAAYLASVSVQFRKGASFDPNNPMNLSGWNPIVSYISPDDGRPPGDLSFSAGGMKLVQVHHTFHFPDGWLGTAPGLT